MKTDLIKYTLVGALILVLILGFTNMYNNVFNKSTEQKLDKIKIINYLKNIKNEADIYYTSNLEYGKLPEVTDNPCEAKGFLQTNTSKKILNILKQDASVSCLFEGSSVIDRWSVVVGSRGSYYCLDTSGNVSELTEKPQNVECR